MTSETTGTGPPRRRGLLLAAGAVVVVVVLAVGWLLVRDSDEPGDSSAEATSTTSAPVDATDPSAAPQTQGPSASVPVERVEGDTPAALCAGVLARLGDYLDATAATTAPDPALVDNFDQFTDEIFTLANGAEWGDRIVEQLTTVRRDWADAAAASGDGDEAAAAEQAAAARTELQDVVDSTSCPTA